MSPKAVREITQQVPTLREHWVAVDATPGAPSLPQIAALDSGAVVVDADPELDALCSRLSEAGKSSLTILYVE